MNPLLAAVIDRIAVAACRRRDPDFDRSPTDPPPPSSSNCDVMCVLPDGRRGYFDGVALWPCTRTTIHSRKEAEDHALYLRGAYGKKARFFAVDIDYGLQGPEDPICDIDGGPVITAECSVCGFGDVKSASDVPDLAAYICNCCEDKQA